MPGPVDPAPRVVGGLSCTQVLEGLPDYLEGDLPDGTRASVEAHLRGCDWCARFGGEYSEVVVVLRETLGPSPDADAGVAERLAERLATELK